MSHQELLLKKKNTFSSDVVSATVANNRTKELDDNDKDLDEFSPNLSDNEKENLEEDDGEDEEAATTTITNTNNNETIQPIDSIKKAGNITPSLKQSVSSKNSLKSSKNPNKNLESSEFLSLKCYKSPTNLENKLYPIKTQNFLKLESLLFDCLGLNNQQSTSNSSTSASTNDLTVINDMIKLHQLDENRISCAQINDMSLLNEKLNYNPISNLLTENMLTQLENIKKNNLHAKSAKTNNSNVKNKDNQLINSDNDEFKKILSNYDRQCEKYKSKAKLITVVLIRNDNEKRPRKSGKILLHSRKTNFDFILNEISNMFRIDFTNLRRLFDLNGSQITDFKELFDNQIVFLFIGNDKIHAKDFDLDQTEIELFFANQPVAKRVYLESLENIEKETIETRAKQQSKLGIERRITSTDNAMNLIPQELLDNYEIGQVIGQGHYALVRQCKDINTGIQFALKIIDLKNLTNNESTIENELNILRKVKHPNIVKLVEEYKTSRFYYLIMEYLKDGDLLEALGESKKYSEKESAGMIRNLACALSYLHSNNIVHRDVKLENILIHKYNDGSAILKLGDFGLACELKKDGDLLNDKCGSPIYVAPEILEHKSYGLEVDVWSLGIICYILLCGFAPFQGSNDKETFESIQKDKLTFPSPYWDEISPEAIDLVKKMLDRNQSTRIDINQVIEHEWINSNVTLNNNNKSTTQNNSNNISESLILNQSISNTINNTNTNISAGLSLNKKTNYKPSKNSIL